MCLRVLVLYFLFLLHFYHLFELTPTIFCKWPVVLPSFLDCRIFWDRGFLHGSLWITKTNMLIVRDWHDGVELQTLDQWDQSSFSIVVHIQIGVFYSFLFRLISTNKRIVGGWRGGTELWIFYCVIGVIGFVLRSWFHDKRWSSSSEGKVYKLQW